MDREDRRKIAFISLLVLGALAAIFFFLWENYLNKGSIVFEGEAPFSVEVFGVDQFECPTSSCTIEQKIGEKGLIITKDGYSSILMDVKVPLWSKEIVKLEFRALPTFSDTNTLPKTEDYTYSIAYSESDDLNKLFLDTDPAQRAIVFFPKTLLDPVLFGSKNHVLVVEKGRENSTYLVDVRNKSKEKISLDFSTIESGDFSKSGDFFIFATSDSDNLMIYSNSKITPTQFKKDAVRYYWIDDDKLAFVTTQIASGSGNNEDSNNIFLSTEDSGYAISFGIFTPTTDSYSLLESYDQQVALPEVFLAGSNGKILYFKNGEQIKTLRLE